MSSAETPSRLLTPREAAEVVSLSVSTLAKRRCLTSEGPRFVRLGRAIRYQLSDLLEFVDRNRHDSTSDYIADTAAPAKEPAPCTR